MIFKSNFGLLLSIVLAFTAERSLGREQWLERDGHAVYLYPRRFGQEQPAVLQKIRDACPGQVCGVLAGQAVTPLLAAQPECSQQDMADAIIDASTQFDAATAAVMVAAAIEYRQVEKNTPPDFTTNPPSLRNSVFCQKAPKNAQLNGLIQAQDPANDPDLFFDPATKATVRKGTQPNTSPFGGAAAANPPAVTTAAATTAAASITAAPQENAAATDCVTEIVVTVTETAAEQAATTSSAPAVVTTHPATPASPPAGTDFGSCTVPEIEFGAGFDGRRETSFRPKDLQSFNHGSAQNSGIITQFICDQLTNSCKANQAAKDLCQQAKTAAAAAPKTGAQADAFNAVFGITTTFANDAVIDNQGNVVSGTVPATGAGGIGNFGSCTTPEIEFGVGFDGRKESSFQPKDKASFNHGSAQNIGIITQFICDTLTNSCKADATAKATCAKAATAAGAAAAKTGAQADAFNAVFNIQTNFAATAAVDDQGKVVPGTGSANAANVVPTGSTSTSAAVATSAAAATSAAVSTGGGIGNFGRCSVPEVEFGAGFDGRRETSFQPKDKASFNHGSAQNINIITDFICDTLTNSCQADQTAKDTCAKALAAAAAAPAKTGAQADAFNAGFGIKTNFAAVTQIDDQGRAVNARRSTVRFWQSRQL